MLHTLNLSLQTDILSDKLEIPRVTPLFKEVKIMN